MGPNRNLGSVFSVIAALLVSSVAFTYWMGLVAVRSARQVAHQSVVIHHLDELLATLTEAETGQRGFLITEQDSYLAPYRQALVRFEAEIQTVDQLARDGDIAPARAEAIRAFAAQKLTELEETIGFVQKGRRDAALDVVRSDRGKRLMDGLRSEVGAAVAIERAERESVRARADRATVLRTATFVSAGALNLAFLIWAQRQIRRQIELRDQAARETVRQKETLAVTLASIGDGVIVTDSEGKVTFLNQEAQRLCGWGEEQARGRKLSEVFYIVNESTRKPVDNPAEKVLRMGRTVGLANHTILIAKDGRERPIDDSAAPIRDAQGTLFGVVLVFRDFSEHKEQERFNEALTAINLQIHRSHQAEAVLQQGVSAAAEALQCESAALSLRRNGCWEVSHAHGLGSSVVGARMNDDEERHAVLAASSQQPVAVDDAFSDARVNLEHMKKWGIRSVLTVPLVLKGEALGVMFFNYTRRAIRFGPAHLEFARKLATSLSLALENSRLVDQLRSEIDERIAAERALKEQKELLQVTLASIGDAVLTTDLQGRVTFINHVAEELSGWSETQALGQPIETVCPLFNEQTRAPVPNPVRLALAERRTVALANQSVLLSKSGREVALEDSAAPICDSTGQVVGGVMVLNDVTQARATARALAESHRVEQARSAELEALMETVPAAVWIAQDPEAKQIIGNAPSYDLLRLPRGANASKTADELDQPQTFEAYRDGKILREELPIQQAARTGQAVIGAELELRFTDGDAKWVVGNAVPLRDSDGRVRGSVGAFIDITDRKRAEQALRDREALYRLLFESANDGIVLHEFTTHPGAGQFLQANRVICQLLGYTSKEMSQLTPFAIQDPAELTAVPEEASRMLESGHCLFEKNLVRKDGQLVATEVNATVFEHQGKQMVLSVIRDVHPRKQAEAALRESQARLAETLASISDGFVAFDRQWRYTYVNTQGAEILHRRPEQMLGRTYLEVFPEAMGSPFEQNFRRAAEENITVRFEAYFGPLQSWYECNCYPSAGGLSVYFRNVNDRKRAEAEALTAREDLARLNASLEATVQERTAKLQETVADLEQFSYSLAHDLRAPLRSMCSFSSFLLEDCGDKLPTESLDFLKRIAAAAGRMDELIRDVLTYSQVLRTQTALGPVDLNRLVRDIVSEYPHLCPAQAEIEIQGTLDSVIGNLALVTQCVSNLLGNAVKFVEPGMKPRLRLWTEEVAGRIRFFVQDNGIGVEPGDVERIWRIFERSHRSKGYPGTGIGLSIVKRAALKMGGTVGMTSTVGVGSTFWLELNKP